MGKPASETAVIPSEIGIGGTGFYPSTFLIVSWKRAYTYKVLTNYNNTENDEMWGWVLHNVLELIYESFPTIVLPSNVDGTSL